MGVRASREPKVLAKPVIKWAGGKSRLVPLILERMPERFDVYFEPFVGGAAVFFALAREGRFKKAVLSDRNQELVNVYRALKKDVDGVIAVLRDFKHEHDEYYRIRELRPEQLSPIEAAARTIYLNKTGYNGLYRVNRRGLFNVPFGRYKRPNFCDEPRLRAASTALKRVVLKVADFERACQSATSADVVYFDPPYVPLSKTSNFTAYHHEVFGDDEHARLARVFGELAKRKVTTILSNSDTERTRELYRAWHVETVDVARPINSRASARGVVSELLVVGKPRSRARRT